VRVAQLPAAVDLDVEAHRAADELDARLPEFCALLVKEAHKTLGDCVAEVREAVDFCRYYAEQAETRLAEQTLQQLDRRIEASGIDVDCGFKGTGVLEIEFSDGSKIIVNSQAAAREIWVAAKSGGYHFRGDGRCWVNTRDGSELFAALSVFVSQQSGEMVNLAAGEE